MAGLSLLEVDENASIGRMEKSFVPPGAEIEITTIPGAHLYRFENLGPADLEVMEDGGAVHRVAPGAGCEAGKGTGQSLVLRARGNREGAAFQWELVAQFP